MVVIVGGLVIVKALVIEIYISESFSLKDKRRVVKSILARCRQKFNVAVAELDHLNDNKKSTLGFVTITNSTAYADEVLDKCLFLIKSEYSVEVISINRERI